MHVADGGDRIRRDAEAAGHGLHEGALVLAGRGDVEIIALRADGGGLRASAFCTAASQRASSAASEVEPTTLQACER